MCSVNECELPTYGRYNECILHCEKTLLLDDNKEELAAFQMGLARYLATYLCGESKKWYVHLLEVCYLYDCLVDYFAKYNQLLPSENPNEKDIRDALRNEVISLPKLHFPAIDTDDNDYLPVLDLFGGIKFQGCHFIDQHNLVLPQTGCFFEGCYFKNHHSVENYPEMPEEEGLPIYRQCHFYHDVGVMGTSQQKKEITRPLFEDCFFEGNETLLQISHCVFNTSLFSDPHIISDPEKTCNLKAFELKNCIFNTPFVLNDCILLDSVFIKDCTFEEKFEFKHNVVKKYNQENCNVGVDKVADFFDSFFKESFHIEKSIFKGFVGFEKCTFGQKNHENKKQTESSGKNPAIFKYVTFLDFANFRYAKFFHGLDIGDSNFRNPPNFLNAEIGHCLENTSRETYRIIKHSFDNVGNYLEANNVFAFEMKRHHKDLGLKLKNVSELSKQEIKKIKSELVIFNINHLSSDFGQSWIRPAYLILLLAVISQFVYCGFDDTNLNNSFLGLNFCEYVVGAKVFLCEQSAAWLIMFILVLLLWWRYCCLIGASVFGLFSLAILLEVLNESFTVGSLVVPVLDTLDNIAKHIPPFNKLLVTGHEFASFVFNILFVILIWQLVIAVKRLTRR